MLPTKIPSSYSPASLNYKDLCLSQFFTRLCGFGTSIRSHHSGPLLYFHMYTKPFHLKVKLITTYRFVVAGSKCSSA